MLLSFESGAVTTMPAAQASQSIGYLPATGDAIIGYHWFNMVSSEIINVITSAGITPSASVVNQLYTAINALISSAIAGEVINRNTAIANALASFNISPALLMYQSQQS